MGTWWLTAWWWFVRERRSLSFQSLRLRLLRVLLVGQIERGGPADFVLEQGIVGRRWKILQRRTEKVGRKIS